MGDMCVTFITILVLCLCDIFLMIIISNASPRIQRVPKKKERKLKYFDLRLDNFVFQKIEHFKE